MRARRHILCVLLVIFLLLPIPALALVEVGSTLGLGVPAVGAKGAALMDVDSGRLLFGKNEQQQLPMASTTKIMTAILAIESGRLDDLVTISDTAVQVEPSSIWLVPGEQIQLLHLVYGLMLRSGNDAACAIAEHLAGSVSAFADVMNQKARQLGMLNTSFRNPHGLPDPEHYTTASDLAKLSAYALRNRQFTAIVSTTRFSSPCEQQGAPRIWYNKNRLLQIYPGADGVKTGWTRAAGYCLVASASRNGQRLVAVVLNSPDDWGETAALLDYGFANYKSLVVVSPGQYVSVVPVEKGYPQYVGAIAAQGFSWPVRQGEQLELRYLVQVEQQVIAPLKKGDNLGYLQIIHQGDTITKIPLIADQSAQRGWWRQLLQGMLTNFRQLLLQGGRYQ